MWIKLFPIILGTSFFTGVAHADDELASNSLKIAFGDQEYVSEINMCQIMPGMVIVAGESDSEPESIKVFFRAAGDESGLRFELIYMLDGVKRIETWDAGGDMITMNALDGKTVTAGGKLQRARVRTMPNGVWEEHPDSDTAAYTTFSLTAQCP